MADRISICNMALAQVVAAPIESLDEPSIEARETGRYYDQALTALLEDHPWGFATRRAALAPIVNPRPGEWATAYALPNDMARPIKVVPSAIQSRAGWWLDDAVIGARYVIEDGTIFSSTPDAVLAYVTSDINAGSMSAKFVDAFALDLASRIVMPIKKNREMKADLIRQAEVAKQRAIADDMNRQPQETSWIDQVQLARDGWGGGCLYGGVNG